MDFNSDDELLASPAARKAKRPARKQPQRRVWNEDLVTALRARQAQCQQVRTTTF
jgi:hypothetical protein